jgi:hypothetical protein
MLSAHDLYTSYTFKNIDYLIHPLNFNLVEDKANYLFISINVLIKYNLI